MSKCSPTNRLTQAFPQSLAEVDSLLSHFLTPPTRGVAPWNAPASLWEAEGRLVVEVDAPGVAPESVEVTVVEGQLSISLERKPGEGQAAHLYNERRFGKVTRTLDLPDSVDPDSVDAELRDGVLRVSITKRPETHPRKVEVRRA